jgi:hypothetical protein
VRRQPRSYQPRRPGGLDPTSSSACRLPAPNRSIPLTHEAVHTVYGILGIVSLALTDHLILISGLAPRSARFLGHDVHSPLSYLILPLSSAASTTSSAYEDRLLALVRHALDTTPLWFSYTFDLTSSLQRQQSGAGPDERFFWNWELTRRLVDAGLSGRKDSVIPGGAEAGGAVRLPSLSERPRPVGCALTGRPPRSSARWLPSFFLSSAVVSRSSKRRARIRASG